MAIWSGFRRSGEPASAKGPPGKRCYVIGDVHGRLDLLQSLLKMIADHGAGRPSKETLVVLLGDIIDRGPDSKSVVALARLEQWGSARVITLSGNHEDLLVRGLTETPAALHRWFGIGGDATARSYGLPVGDLIGRPADEIAVRLLQAIPAGDLAFLKRLPVSARFGDYLLVHAGVRPGVPFEDQSPDDLRWIRKPFLESHADHGCIVVHGHSETAQVEELPNRIGLDTGAYRTGVLTALWIEDESRGFLQARDGGGSAPLS